MESLQGSLKKRKVHKSDKGLNLVAERLQFCQDGKYLPYAKHNAQKLHNPSIAMAVFCENINEAIFEAQMDTLYRTLCIVTDAIFPSQQFMINQLAHTHDVSKQSEQFFTILGVKMVGKSSKYFEFVTLSWYFAMAPFIIAIIHEIIPHNFRSSTFLVYLHCNCTQSLLPSMCSSNSCA